VGPAAEVVAAAPAGQPLGLLDLVIHMLVARPGEPNLCSLAEAAERRDGSG